jgi:hypothetical protein
LDCFSHERNKRSKKRIVEAIEITHNTPDFYLLKSQIAQFEGNQAAALKIGMLILLCLRKIIMEQCIINTTL